jgi:hypothetical protein
MTSQHSSDESVSCSKVVRGRAQARPTLAALKAQLAAVPAPAAPLNFAAADALVAQANSDAAAVAPAAPAA